LTHCHKVIAIIGRPRRAGVSIVNARISTAEPVNGLEAQKESLKAIGCDKLHEEQASATGPRKALTEELGYVREGDILVVTKLDRLARSVVHLGEIVAGLEAKSVGLLILDLGLDTTTATGKLMLNVLGSVAQFEREMILERQRDGIARAKAQGKYKGRKSTAQAKKAEVVVMLAEGRSKRDVARALGMPEKVGVSCYEPWLGWVSS
jgi:DNA invertase Pin-like site-specific DNA recombinase